MSHLIPKRVKHWVSKYFQTNFNIEMVFEQTLEIKGKNVSVGVFYEAAKRNCRHYFETYEKRKHQ